MHSSNRMSSLDMKLVTNKVFPIYTPNSSHTEVKNIVVTAAKKGKQEMNKNVFV